MSDLRDALSGLARALAPKASGAGRCVLLMSACRSEGVSQIARSLAEATAQRAQRAVLLIDLDLLRDGQYRHYEQASREGGPGLGAGVSGALGRRVFFSPAQAAPAFSLHRVGSSRLLVSHWQGSRWKSGGALSVQSDPSYWTCARKAADCVVIDAPSLERSRVGLVLAKAMDAVVIVTSARTGLASETQTLQAELAAMNAPLAGIIYADADPTALAIGRAFSPAKTAP
jgi:Mrp family chromosome partitioning ATPase